MREHLREIIRAAGLIAFAAVVVIMMTVAGKYGCAKVPESYEQMKPAVKAGDSLFISRDAQTLRDVPVGMVIVYRLLGAQQDNVIGRVVAHPGQVVAAGGGAYHVDGQKLSTRAKPKSVGEFDGLIVPRDCVFIGFDSGSRARLNTCIVPLRNIIGKVTKK